VLQKFEEIAEKVEKIEKQSLESGPSAKDKPQEEDKKPEKLQQPEKLVQAPAASNSINDIRSSENVAATAPEIVKVVTKDEIKLEIKSHEESEPVVEPIKPEDLPAAPVESRPVVAEEPKEKPAENSAPKADAKPANTEARVDPIVQLIKSQEPLSYRVGEKMMESKKVNDTAAAEKPKTLAGSDADSELKNEMRRKRDTSENEQVISSLERTLLENFELKSILTRELKASRDDN